MEQKQPENINEPKEGATPKVPNDTARFNVDGFLRIHDPNTKEIFVEIRE